MKAGKKAKMITLAVTLVCLAAVGTGIYFFTGEEEPEMVQRPESAQETTQTEEPEVSETAPEPETVTGK